MRNGSLSSKKAPAVFKAVLKPFFGAPQHAEEQRDDERTQQRVADLHKKPVSLFWLNDITHVYVCPEPVLAINVRLFEYIHIFKTPRKGRRRPRGGPPGRAALRKTHLSFLSACPYVCPEPVLVK